MGWIVLTIIVFFVVAVTLVGSHFIKAEDTASEDSKQAAFLTKWGIRVAVCGGLILIWGIITLFSSVRTVPAGHRGLVYEFGNIISTEKPGLAVIAPWQSMKTANVQVQKFTLEDDATIGAASIDSQNVYLRATLNFSIAKCEGIEAKACIVDNEAERAIVALYKDVGPNYVDKVIRPRYLETAKQQTVLYKAEDMLPNRAKLAGAIEVALRKSLEDDPRFNAISVISFNIENIDFDQGFNDRIKAKVEAQQQTLVENENIKIREAQAKQAVAEAQGQADKRRIEAQANSDVLRIEAEGKAQANNLLNASLTPSLLQYEAIKRFSDKIQIALLPSDGNFLLDPSRLLQPQP